MQDKLMKKIFWILPAVLILNSCLSLGGVMDNAFDQAADDMVSSTVGSSASGSSDNSGAGNTKVEGPVSSEPTRENVIAAIQTFDVDSLEKILADVDDVKTIVRPDDLLLHMAEEAMGVSGRENPVAELLVAKKAYILQRDDNGRSWERVIQDMELAATPRHDFIIKTIGDKFQRRYDAVMADDLATFRRYEQYGPMDGPLLWEAGRAKASGIAVYMVDQGADVNYLNPRKNISTLQATCSNFVPNDYPKTYADFEPIVKALLDAGADPNTRSDDNYTPLLQLTYTEMLDNPDTRGNPADLYEMLLEAGADTSAVNSNRFTALDSTVGNLTFPNPAVVELLLDYGAEITEIAIQTLTSDLPTIQLLVAYGADIHAMARTVRTFSNDEAGQLEYYKYMLAAGADINDFNLRASTAYTENARYLIDQGADVSVRYYKNKTFLHIAVQNSKADLVEILIEAGADVNAIDDDGDTPLDELQSGQSRIEAALLNAGAEGGS